MNCHGGRALNGLEANSGYQIQSNYECRGQLYRSETTRDKLRGQKGNSPDRQLRSLTMC
jgi:hypothetical protein